MPQIDWGVQVSNVFNIKQMFDEKDDQALKWSGKTLATPVNKLPCVDLLVGEGIGSVVAGDFDVQVAFCEEKAGVVYKIDRRRLEKILMQKLLPNLCKSGLLVVFSLQMSM